jgi:hypothetical protein
MIEVVTIQPAGISLPVLDWGGGVLCGSDNVSVNKTHTMKWLIASRDQEGFRQYFKIVCYHSY